MTYPPPQNPYQGGPSQPNYGQQPHPTQPQGAPGHPPQDPYTQPVYGQQQSPPASGYQQPGYPQGGYQQPGGYQQGGYPPGAPYQEKKNSTGLVIALVLGAVLVIGLAGAGFYFFGDDDDDTPQATETSEASEENTDDPEPTDSPDPADDEPGTDAEMQSLISEYSLPEVGECLDDDPNYYVIVDCNDPSAQVKILRWVPNPADPNPNDHEHTDAADAVCQDLPEYDWYFWIDTSQINGTTWDPAADEILAIGCATEVN
ncbi:hypothetical protein [Natronoglycomyces albus]|uniref:Uncharacterized protein n=1 Tax=Natronoglycomyces albus TaxID=2811108 RepID=A0A895XNY0_9ACTN|nr:hypothetical protein [Natronoglycomyces albus]QSB04000.1 hypothetical protein JQS30_09200 [Natronoglycomyces albus]